MAEVTQIGYFDLTGPAEKDLAGSQSLVRIKDVVQSMIFYKATVIDLIDFLAGLIDIPGIPLDIVNVSKEQALGFVKFFLLRNELEIQFGGELPGQPHVFRPQQTFDSRLWVDSVPERAWDKRLFGKKKRRRGAFIPGVRKSKNPNAQFMRIRVPHR